MTRPTLTFAAHLRFDLILRSLAEVPHARSFMEVGCGQGELGAWLARRYHYLGFEPDTYSFRRAHARIGQAGEIRNMTVPDKPTGRYDWVGAFEVIEHIDDDSATLASWRRWLTPEGRLILSTPAHPQRFGALDRLAGHCRRYARADLERALRNAGFRNTRIYAYGFPLGYVLEFGRNVLARRRRYLPRGEATLRSSRWLHPTEHMKWIPRLVTAPFLPFQRPFANSNLGTGWVAVAER